MDRAIQHEGHERREGMFNDNIGPIIGLAIKVHRRLGPGLLDSAYEPCLYRELDNNGLNYARQVPLPPIYEGLSCAYRAEHRC